MIDVTINRDRYIGGSDLPTILGYNKVYNKSIIQFAREKLKLVYNSFDGNEYTEYGNIMEPKMRDYLNEVYGMNFKPDTVVDEVRKYRGNCDGLDKEHGVLLECKTFSGKLKVDYYTPQCQFYMELFNIDECWLVGYERPKNFYHGIDYALENDHAYFNSDFDEKRLVIYKITRDKDMFREIEVEIDKFKYLLKCLKEEEEINARRNRQ